MECGDFGVSGCLRLCSVSAACGLVSYLYIHPVFEYIELE